MEYKLEDLILSRLTLPYPTPIRITVDDKYLRLYIGPRDYQFDKKTGKRVGSGTCLA